MLRPFLVAVLAAAVLAPQAIAQARGVPASVTSIRRGANFSDSPPGVAASVTSLGPLGFGRCCGSGVHVGAGVSFGHNPRFHVNFGFGHHRRRHPVFVPVHVGYPVYPVYYAQPQPEVVIVEEPEPPAPTIFERRSTRAPAPVYRDEPLADERGRDADSRYGEHRFGEEPRASRPRSDEDEPDDVAEQTVEERVPTVLVFRNGTTREVRNYAIVGEQLFDLDAHRARKIPLADLDLAATVQRNDERGVDFTLPRRKG